MQEKIKGSHLWNNAWSNKNLIQKYRLWEICTGNLALFWEDSWKQKLSLNNSKDINETIEQNFG